MIKWIFLVISLISQLKIEAQISDFKNINFKNADAIAYSYKGNDLSNLPGLARNLTHNLPSDVEKFRSIYTWVSTNIECDYTGCKKNITKRSRYQNDSLERNKWDKSFSNQVFIKLIKEKKTICTGYAYLVKTLANLENINCEIIDGFGRNESSIDSELKFPNHSWNAVQLNNKWYLCDATWSSGAYNLSKFTFEFNYNDGYFLANPELFAKDHYPNDNSWLLLSQKPLFSEFLIAPIVYDNAYKYAVFPIEPSTMNVEVKKNEETIFILKEIKTTDINSIFLQINYGSSIEFVKPKTELLKNDRIKINYTFNNIGTYDVHINLGIHPICTYVVKVKSAK
ncbi:transglutaminase domain-containing protein [Flavobacterium sp. SUN052]|uniref:transglutaminase domain-containing protein n=1 Tax=Flavobacterium sp. SUN052 TaxID=3002441 RepID=UPI00237EC387|nr:transglutaminase domain-containing protein [Flavobacterium sp. SUN052]MEC4005179.1 transglutaminase domain-containing protein [Flavobacterium sp. SUN052]